MKSCEPSNQQLSKGQHDLRAGPQESRPLLQREDQQLPVQLLPPPHPTGRLREREGTTMT